MYSKQRGLWKGEMRTSDWLIGDMSGNNETNYEDVSFVLIDGQVYMRSSHLPD